MRTQVLIIGGGFAGASTAQALEKKGIKTILVDKKNYFEVTYAVLRDVAAPSKNRGQSRKLYSEFIDGQFVQGTVMALQANCASLENGQTIYFEKVIIASGSRYPSLPLAKSVNAITLNNRNEELTHYHKQLKDASAVLIIGGGVVGVELAGELAYAMPHLKITLAHNGTHLLNGFKSKASKKALEQLTRLGVRVEFDAHYQANESGFKDEKTRKKISPDIAFSATGVVPNNEFLKQHFAHILNKQGHVIVDENLKVVGQRNMFAIGDIADVGEAKLGYLAVEQGKHLANSIAKQLLGNNLKSYKRHPFMALVPTGQETGIVQLPFMVSTWKPLVNIKQKDLFISKTFDGMA
ncbi:NAD(P)/FAD-dependent oxidoreductase [Pseudoalteromonas luteoviolacea]|uniref:FAD/NAD(P)-binding domain-containing protein n=1 Tax=Pseudoalteromonas luteoviolacea DSM 6061 TaxID=1365250 RepID=A0A167D978_9GAMM|nr:FAD-dependent oxidoreductase [Pseudoalteromonas luteoviolacea]KZN48565.1 hypothetical protein N475_05935 [Pseudoalteromonas luteoviolacea DSM 6061]MBE0388732.1 hypothetical protein [Pseudoalteromonas luteoviolacea DSM 6061]